MRYITHICVCSNEENAYLKVVLVHAFVISEILGRREK